LTTVRANAMLQQLQFFPCVRADRNHDGKRVWIGFCREVQGDCEVLSNRTMGMKSVARRREAW